MQHPELATPFLTSDDKKNDCEKYLFQGKNGCHLATSPVVGSRAHEAKAVLVEIKKQGENSVLKELDLQLHHVNLYRIPRKQMQAANAMALEIFQDYIKKYAQFGFTTENIIHWVETQFLFENITTLHDKDKGSDTWYIEPKTERESRVEKQYHFEMRKTINGMLPRGVVSLHELMHAEETEKNCKTPGLEILTSLRSHILVDTIFKKLNNIDINSIVNCGAIRINGREIPLGELINFYRKLEEKEGSLYKAVLSTASLNYLSGIVAEHKSSVHERTLSTPSATMRNRLYTPVPTRQADEKYGCCEPTCFSWLKRTLGCG
jgi:hypothetical protein